MIPPAAPPQYGYPQPQGYPPGQGTYYVNQGYNDPYGGQGQGYPGAAPMGVPGYGPPMAGYPQTQGGLAYGGGPPAMPVMPPRPQLVEPGVDVADGESAKYGMGFSNTSIRQGFIRKVFGIVTLQLLVVTLMVLAVFISDEARSFIRTTTTGRILYYVSYGVFIGTYLVLACCEGVRRKSPLNIMLTALLTLAAGYMSAMITAYHDVEVVLIAVGVCTLVCGTIIIFATQTKYDFTKLLGIMFVVSMVVMVFGIVAILANVFFQIRVLYLIYAGVATLMFMVYLAIDVQMIMGGKRHELSPEDYVYGALQLFMDIIYIFWFLVQLIGECL